MSKKFLLTFILFISSIFWGSSGSTLASELRFLDIVRTSKEESSMLNTPIDRVLSKAFSYCEINFDLSNFLRHDDPDCLLYFTYLTYRIYLNDEKPHFEQDLVDVLLENMLQHPSVQIKTISAHALGAMTPKDEKTIKALIEIFDRVESEGSQRAIIEAINLNQRGQEEVILFLTNVIENSDNEVIQFRSAVAIKEGLNNRGDTIKINVLEDLIDIIKKPDLSANSAIEIWFALNSIEKIEDKELLKFLNSFLSRYSDAEISEKMYLAGLNFADRLYRKNRLQQKESNAWLELRRNKDIVSNLYERLEALQVETPKANEYKKKIKGVIDDFERDQQLLVLSYIRSWAIGSRAYWVAHPLFWLALIFAYPYSPQVQATFFWNKHVRDILGLWYVGMILRSIPPLRQRLFAPFRESLLADAKLDVFATHPYFPDSEIQLKGSQQRQPLTTAIPAIKGQIILEGESGLGKTMLLRHLVNRSQRLTVYLPAYKCEAGVIEAIQAKLHGQAQDADFLRHLIYSGALDICIDGLNEVRAEVRANITSFVESYFKGNIVMTTQPLVWNPPATAKTYVIQPLRRDQVQQFLALVEPSCADAPENSEAYSKNCAYFLEQALNPDQPPEDGAIARRILSNPMDLSIVAQILAKGIIPELFQLQQQQYWLMAQDYEQAWNQKFPLQKFSESVYQMRLNDTYSIDGDTFYQAVAVMEREDHRMILSRQWQAPDGKTHKEWSFRHDKIMEFFLVQPFLGHHPEAIEKRHNHIGDPRFRGIYLLLARLLPLDAALDLREALIHYAADTKDHTVSDSYVQIMRSRQDVPAALSFSYQYP